MQFDLEEHDLDLIMNATDKWTALTAFHLVCRESIQVKVRPQVVVSKSVIFPIQVDLKLKLYQVILFFDRNYPQNR